LQVSTNLLLIITSTVDELPGDITIDDLNDLKPPNTGFYYFFCYFRLRRGTTEMAGVDIVARSKMQGWTSREWTLRE